MKFAFRHWSRALPVSVILVAIGLQVACSQFAVGQLIEPITMPANEKQRVKFWLDLAWKKNLDNRTQSVDFGRLCGQPFPSQSRA